MSKHYEISVEETRAIKIKANAGLIADKEGEQGYAMMWLNLTNNRREHKQSILKIYNDSDNGIYVVCDAHEANVKAVESYLVRLGLVIEYKDEVAAIMPEEVFNDDDLKTELIDW